MRFICLLFLIAVVVCIAIFVVQNQIEQVKVQFWDRSLTVSVPVLVGAVYGLGMLTGWSVVGVLRRSLDRATQYSERPPVQAR